MNLIARPQARLRIKQQRNKQFSTGLTTSAVIFNSNLKLEHELETMQAQATRQSRTSGRRSTSNGMSQATSFCLNLLGEQFSCSTSIFSDSAVQTSLGPVIFSIFGEITSLMMSCVIDQTDLPEKNTRALLGFSFFLFVFVMRASQLQPLSKQMKESGKKNCMLEETAVEGKRVNHQASEAKRYLANQAGRLVGKPKHREAGVLLSASLLFFFGLPHL